MSGGLRHSKYRSRSPPVARIHIPKRKYNKKQGQSSSFCRYAPDLNKTFAAVVVGEAEGRVVDLGGEAEGVFGDEVAVGDAGGAGSTGDGAEGGVVVVGGDAVLEGVVEYLGDVLVAVVGVEEVEAPVLGTHDERTSGDGLGGIPHKLCTDGVAVGGIQPLDAEEVVVNKAEVRGNLILSRLLIVHAAAHAVKGHRDNRVILRPTDGAILGVVDD